MRNIFYVIFFIQKCHPKFALPIYIAIRKSSHYHHVTSPPIVSPSSVIYRCWLVQNLCNYPNIHGLSDCICVFSAPLLVWKNCPDVEHFQISLVSPDVGRHGTLPVISTL